MGESLRRAGDREALDWFQRVIAEHPQSAFVFPARYWAGWCLTWHKDDPSAAIPYFQEVLAKDGDDWRIARALWCLAHCHVKLGEYDKGLATCQELLSRSGENYAFWHGFAHQTMGYIHYQQKHYEQAKEELRLTMSRYPGGIWAWEAYRVLRDVEAAEAESGSGG